MVFPVGLFIIFQLIVFGNIIVDVVLPGRRDRDFPGCRLAAVTALDHIGGPDITAIVGGVRRSRPLQRGTPGRDTGILERGIFHLVEPFGQKPDHGRFGQGEKRILIIHDHLPFRYGRKVRNDEIPFGIDRPLPLFPDVGDRQVQDIRQVTGYQRIHIHLSRRFLPDRYQQLGLAGGKRQFTARTRIDIRAIASGLYIELKHAVVIGIIAD